MPEDIHWQQYQSRFRTFPAWLEITDRPAEMIVCIPVFSEPDVITTLESLSSCDNPGIKTEVILLYNQRVGMTDDEMNIHLRSWQQTNAWIELHKDDFLIYRPVFAPLLPGEKGGVGLARKLALDEAARRIGQEGVLLCLDADCKVERKDRKSVV